MRVLDPALTRDEIQQWVDGSLVPFLELRTGLACRADVRYADRGVGFPQTVNDEPARWHIQAWHYELCLTYAPGSATDGYELAELIKAVMDEDQTLGGRLRDASLPVKNVHVQVPPRQQPDGTFSITLPLSIFDVEAGPA